MQHIHSGFLKLALTASILLGAGLAVTPVMAASTTFQFTGLVDTTVGIVSQTAQTSVSNIGSNLLDDGNPINGTSPFGSSGLTPIGNPFLLSGSFTFSDATPNSGNSTIGVYNNTLSQLTFNLSNSSGVIYTGTYNNPPGLSTPNSIVVFNDFLATPPPFFSPGLDGLSLTTPILGPQVNGLGPLTFELELLSPFAPFTNNSLPTTTLLSPPSVNPFLSPNFRVVFAGGGTPNTLRGDLTSLTAVPLPPAVILFGAGLVALIGLGARNWQRARTEG
ncbi:MAG: hypothetical protein HZB34_09390 [Nitrospirae bacterium]|nr:hypothetical protein [Nitrospirota bacterium]